MFIKNRIESKESLSLSKSTRIISNMNSRQQQQRIFTLNKHSIKRKIIRTQKEENYIIKFKRRIKMKTMSKCLLLAAILLLIFTTTTTSTLESSHKKISTITNNTSTLLMTTINNSDNFTKPLEQVAKAEALVSSQAQSKAAATIAASSSPSSTSSQTASIIPIATSAAIVAPQSSPLSLIPNQDDVKLFQVCKLQSRVNLQLTNLSQIMFQPSEICSTWFKMIKSPSTTLTTTKEDVENSASSYPWFYIERLDLSQNNLTVLQDYNGFHKLTNLLELIITYNQLNRCEENSLAGLQKLENLDISHNKLMALPAKFFQPVRNTIRKLNLSFNSISVLVPSLFDFLINLEYLDLSHNEITSHWISDKVFKNLTKLRYLDLSFNKLTVFSSPMTFYSLQQLETLSLQHNELRQVPETIQYLRYLSTLDLSQNLIRDITNASYLSNCRLLFNLNLESNLLENITSDAFNGLPALKVLNLANNKIQHLDQQAFDYVSDIHAIRLDSNRLIDFGQAFVNLSYLVMLNISSNRIASFDYAQIPFGLQWLDIHSNKIDKLNNFYYSAAAQQQYSSNDINGGGSSNIGQQWQSTSKLTILDASFNLIKEIDNTSFPESLETAQLNNNNIKSIASHTFFTKPNITRINLSNNQLSTLPYDSLKLHNYREMQQQQQHHQQSMITNGQKIVDIYLANNPYVCNCNMGWLSQLLLASSTLQQANNFSGNHHLGSNNAAVNSLFSDYHLILTRQLPRVADANLINCHIPFSRQQLSNPSSSDAHLWSPMTAANQLAIHHHHNHHLHTRDTPLIVKQSDLLASVHLCPYKSHCFALCYCCDFDACDCEMSCPENCSCYYDQSWSTNIVDCSANNQFNGMNYQFSRQQLMQAPNQYQRQIPQQVKFTNIPDKIPMDVTELYLDGLELLHLKGNALIGRRYLKSLYLNNSQLHSIEPKALATQKALRVLQLNSNSLKQLHGHEFEQQVELRELYLANNQLTSIANITFTPLISLQILHLENNQLYHMNLWSNFPNTNNQLISFNLGNNPWSCQCDHIESMLQWLHLNVKHIHDRKSVNCQYNRTNSLHLIPPLLTSQTTNLLQGAPSSDGNSLATSDDNYSTFDSQFENYPMFDMRMCLNYTVLVQQPIGNQQQKTPILNFDQNNLDIFAKEANQPTIKDLNEDIVNNSSFVQPLPNDEPFLTTQHPEKVNSIQVNSNNLPYDNYPTRPIQHEGYQLPPNNSLRQGNNFSPSVLLGGILIIIVFIIIILSLVYYRNSMGVWFYSRYGLNMFAATKSAQHHHPIGSLGKHSQLHHPHLHHHHQYGASSTGSTSSSSAASSNLSQALCQQQQQQQTAAATSSGLVTTPLIVTNNQLFNSNATTTSSPYNDDEKLFDAYITYSKLDEQFINDCIAPELEYGQPSYRVALHYRDLPVTTSEFLTDCIIETANASRRIIMVLSEQMLKTEWTKYEFRSAHLEALRNNYRHRLIVIMLGQPSLATLDSDILLWLKSCACIQWGDKMFWQRLRFSMPELPFNRQQPQYLRYQTLAPHQTGASGKQNKLSGAGNLGVSLLKSLTGSGGGGGGIGINHLQQPAQMQQLITTSNSMHQSLNRPLPHQPTTTTATNQSLATAGGPIEEHHYAHLTPATMIYNHQQQQQQQQQQMAHTYHQPIYGDPAQQQQQQQQQQQHCNNQRDNPTVPVHI